ncbi:unnamed protein product [Bursaphelenchus xylophilus]|uniref:(pine wood nematode) hypothetical protein n=1 Tax=Bursaphelenchus xylophilus TaxID=6326 RepID=A0A1I7RU66_BURXY|nr:unnamed protein product [Bursaphelenchus xylophilus]CAG9113859.1 unnamed protein product [Bursaphelenchus xylophilus]
MTDAEAKPLKRVPQHVMVFPVSSRPQARRLVLRNPTGRELAVKLVATCPKALQIDGPHLIIAPNEWNSTNMVLDANKVAEQSDLQFHSVLVYCRLRSKFSEVGLADWFNEEDNENPINLAYSLKIHRTIDFAAPDTVVDLPGKACLVEPINAPTFDYDPRDVADCLTARGVESETATANQLSETDLLACCPDSLAKTALEFDDGTRTARWIGRGCCAVKALDSLYPGSGQALQKKVGTVFPCGQA